MRITADGLSSGQSHSYVKLSDLGAFKAQEDSLDFAKVVKDYMDEALTGMTEEEWEEFRKLCKNYLDARPIRTEADRAAFVSYMKGVLKKMGFKGDMDEFCDGVIGDLGKKEKDFVDTAKASADQTIRKVVTEPNGERYLLVTTDAGQTFKIRISDEEESLIEA